MPLENAAAGTPGFSRNVATEVNAGKPQKQAVAIAYSKARGDAARSSRAVLQELQAAERDMEELKRGGSKTSQSQRLLSRKINALEDEYMEAVQGERGGKRSDAKYTGKARDPHKFRFETALCGKDEYGVYDNREKKFLKKGMSKSEANTYTNKLTGMELDRMLIGLARKSGMFDSEKTLVGGKRSDAAKPGNGGDEFTPAQIKEVRDREKCSRQTAIDVLRMEKRKAGQQKDAAEKTYGTLAEARKAAEKKGGDYRASGSHYGTGRYTVINVTGKADAGRSDAADQTYDVIWKDKNGNKRRYRVLAGSPDQAKAKCRDAHSLYVSAVEVVKVGTAKADADYNEEAVNKAIAAQNRSGRGKVGGREGKMIHALLKGSEGYASRNAKKDATPKASGTTVDQLLSDAEQLFGRADAMETGRWDGVADAKFNGIAASQQVQNNKNLTAAQKKVFHEANAAIARMMSGPGKQGDTEKLQKANKLRSELGI